MADQSKQIFDPQKFYEMYQKILEFNHVRGWHPHPSDIAKSVVIESAELLELFQWPDSYKDLPKMSDDKRTHVMHEMADIMWYLFNLANELNINIIEALEVKYDHNEKKYPADKFKDGENTEFYYQQKQLYRQEK